MTTLGSEDTPDAEEPPHLEAKIGAYRLVRVIGRGGMGVVYEAVHETIGQRAAVKVLSPAHRDAGYRRRFANEARAACTVRHPGLVNVFDCGELEDGSPYLLMELIEGESLRARLRRGTMPFEVASELIAQIAAALSVVHARGIVHRDVKPENVMLVSDGRNGFVAKLLDFGIARVPWEDVTREWTVLGTPSYMAPEQRSVGAEVTAGSDVYALGIIFFELLRGAPPPIFREVVPVQARARLDTPIDALDGVPAEVARMINAMLQSAASLRPSAAAVRDVLGSRSTPTLSSSPTLAPPELQSRPRASASSNLTPGKSPWRQRSWWGIGALAVVTLGLVSARGMRPRRAAIQQAGMVHLAGGRFTMGRGADDLTKECERLGSECIRSTLDREQPAHPVTVSPFLLDVTEATNRDFVAWLALLGSRLSIREEADRPVRRYVSLQPGNVLLVDTGGDLGGLVIGPDGIVAARPGYESRPVVQVSWDAAQLYCASRGKRLPTEAEYEFASRGGPLDRPYPWGDAAPRCEGVVFGRVPDGPCPGFPPGVVDVTAGDQDWSAEGVHGLGGNASEWVADAFLQPYYEECGGCADPVARAPREGEADLRVFRGSGWSNGAMFVRATGRARWDRRSVQSALGVRCALSSND